jgi:hypothetical protein
VNFSMINFLESGSFSVLRIGDQRDDARRLLGVPDDTATKDLLWRYGSVQFGFSGDGRVSLIAIYFTGASTIFPKAVSMSGWIPTSATTLEEFLFATACVEMKADPALSFDEQICVRSPAGVGAYFVNGVLKSVQVSDVCKKVSRSRTILR